MTAKMHFETQNHQVSESAKFDIKDDSSNFRPGVQIASYEQP